MIENSKIPQEIQKISKTLENKGFEAYLVGGCVRDLLLGHEPKDWDFTTNAKPNELIVIFPDSFYENNFGTVGIKTRSTNPKLEVVEITPYRKESNYSDGRHPDNVEFSQNIDDDLARRDFTVNAIAYNISKGHIKDNYKGQESLKTKTLVAVGSAEDRFKEDALRMLRAIRFASELGFIIEINTLNAILKCSEFMKNVSRERIRDEFEKIIMSKNPMIGIGLSQKLGILPYISTYLEDMVDVSQNKQAHKYDVFEHSLRTLQHAADSSFSKEVRFAALFHDIAKPITKKVSGGKTTFYGHDVVGAKVTRETLKNLSFDKDFVEKVANLVRWHMFFSDTEEITPSAARRLIKNVGKENIWDLINLRKCDRIGTGRPKEEPYRLRKFEAMLDEVMRDPISVSMLKIDGNILINDLKIKAGPKIGWILHALLEEVLEDPKKNTEMFLMKRSEQLNLLPENKLRELGEKGKDTKNEAEIEEISKIRAKRYVK